MGVKAGPKRAEDLKDWNGRIQLDTGRFFFGEAVPDAKVDSPLFDTLARTLVDAGRAGFKMAEPGDPDPSVHLVLPTRHHLGGPVLAAQAGAYRENVTARAHGEAGTKAFGFTLTSDGTNRHGRGVIDVAFVFKSGEVVFWELKDTSGESKSDKWLCDFLVDVVMADDFPLPREDIVTISMDGGCRTAFPMIEKRFKEDPMLPNVVCQWCSCHTWNLLLKAVADVDGIDTLIAECRELITFVRSHDKPRSMLQALANKGLVRWVETRFGTVFLCMDRLHKVMGSLRTMVGSDGWTSWRQSLAGDALRKADDMAARILDPTFDNRIVKVNQLVEPIFAALRTCDSDLPTAGIVYQLFLETQHAVAAWEATKFAPIKAGPAGVAFREGECTLLSKGNHEDTGKAAGGGWTVEAMLVHRWNKMHGAGMTGRFHATARVLNPAFRAYKHGPDPGEQNYEGDDLKQEFHDFLDHYYDDPAVAAKVYNQFRAYLREDPKGPLFYDGDVEKTTCSWTGPDRGLSGADWWSEIPYKYEFKWAELRALAMKVLSQTSTESAAERHFSAVEVVQPKGRASLTPESVKQRTFLRAEIQGDIASRAVGTLLTIEDLERHEARGGDDSVYHAQN